MYESPVEMITRKIASSVAENVDGLVLRTLHECGINVNERELVKALEYDRQQYEQGYRDAKDEDRKLGRWVNGCCDKCGGHAPFWCMSTGYYQSNYCPDCGAKMRVEYEE
jgi:hypothetical protein